MTDYKNTATGWSEAFLIFANHDTCEDIFNFCAEYGICSIGIQRDTLTLAEISRLDELGWTWNDETNKFVRLY